MRSFPLAPMSFLIVVLTILVLAVPVVFLLAGAWAGTTPLVGIGLLLAAGCGLVWLYARPNRFEVSSQGLVIVWPLRRQLIPARDIACVRPIEPWELRQEVGWGVRIGVGGLWGQFGWLWTARKGSLVTYVSRTDGLVLVERRSRRPLLITPAHRDDFVRALQSSIGGMPAPR
ncbi:MAG: hypothetical protein HYY64_17750 [Candidatus Rokubacteria bacterium]|nr:hypothetical protein [Candidatus Rokubacteria bacterium]